MLKGSETVDGRGANEYAPATDVGVLTLPPTDVAAHLLTECPTETNDDSGLLRGAEMSSFGRKWKLRNMHDISECLCGNSAVPLAGNKREDVVCCRITGCETKWYHLSCVGPLSSAKGWTCEVCLSDAGKGKRTFASLDDSPGIPTTVQPTPTSATKKVRNVGPAHGRPMQLQLTSESEVVRPRVRQPPSAGITGATRKVSPLSRHVPQPSSLSYCAPSAPSYSFGPEPALRPTYWDQDPYPTTEEDSTDDDNLAALTQGDPSKLQKVMASEIKEYKLLLEKIILIDQVKLVLIV
ncbi:hypothetical protein EDB92DRAFT_1818479 [Lactarius akahatsu]|uniref:Zinc finger PHD-type domain-containing protein n=1 Tax=Lactarius akahatsu TaxID=416441 RepID=A0AAD4LDV3_9AGAM|nr:hypothetical protein EDB92DRAFT_1818479 [Lactarius akahatsu]